MTEPLATLVPGELSTLSCRPLFAFQIDVRKPDVVGATPGHDRRIGEITGGRFEGPKLRGKVLSGGSDWQSLRRDGATTLNVRIVLQTDDDALIAMTYLLGNLCTGFATALRLQSSAARHRAAGDIGPCALATRPVTTQQRIRGATH
jgi:hypothetical protein